MSDSDSEESLLGRHRSTRWRRKRRRDSSSSSGETVTNVQQSSSDVTFETSMNMDTAELPDDNSSHETDEGNDNEERSVHENVGDSEGHGDEDDCEDGDHEDGHEDDDREDDDREDEGRDQISEDEDSGDQDSEGDGESEEDNEGYNEEDEDEDHGPMFSFAEGALNRPLVMHGNKTAKDALVLDLALLLRHKWTYTSLLDNFSVKNLLFETKYFPTSKKELFRLLGRNDSGMVAYAYCDCGNLIGKKKELDAVVRCGCTKEVIIAEAKVFYVLSLKQQFKQFLETPGIPEQLKYRERRTKQDTEAIEDVFDSKRYKELQMKMSELDFTFNINTDGCKIGKKAKTTLYPVFARVNELPPSLRQKHIFIIGLFGDKCDPNMESFLNPIVDEINQIAKEGVSWYPNGDQENNEPHVSRFFMHCYCVDGKANSQILNMVSHQSDYACSSCTFKGVNINKIQRYPAEDHPLIPPYEERTHAKMVQDMWQAYNEKTTVHGHKGLSALLALENFDLVQGKGFDDLHFFYECAAKHHFELLLNEAPRVKDPTTDKPFTYAAMERIINARLRKIRTPSSVARKPSNMVLKNREQFTGTEWRNILLYYGVPCLKGLIKPSYIKHFEMLSTAAHILSRDVIFEKDIERADKLIDKYLKLYEQYYGIERTRLNLHTLKHAGNSVRILGPLFTYSTFNFESWNHKLLLHIKSAKEPLLQILVKHFVRMFLEHLSATSEDLSEETREKIVEILQVKKLRVTATPVKEHIYVMDKVQEKVLTENERRTLEREGLPVEQLTFYNKMIFHSCQYQTKSSVKVKALSDDSMIYSRQDTFCTIDSILVSQDNQGNKIVGLLVYEHDVLPDQLNHICRLSPQEFDLIHFLPCDLVKCPVVQIPINDDLYVAPIPNTFEID